jgi:peptidyl-prolyl cis-trans isomerase B (cyclophilin B)
MKAIYTLAALLCGMTLVMASAADCQEVKKVDVAALRAETPDSVAVIDIEHAGQPLGRIVLRFFPDVAPKHVANFKNLADRHLYDGTTFHRVIPGFMIQGGDMNSKNEDRSDDGFGAHPDGITIPAEFSTIPHTRGIVSMARSAKPNSAGCQFFICVANAPHLNEQYSVFGEVIEGMDVVDKIAAVKRDSKNNPEQKVTMTKVTIQPYKAVMKEKETEKPKTKEQ